MYLPIFYTHIYSQINSPVLILGITHNYEYQRPDYIILVYTCRLCKQLSRRENQTRTSSVSVKRSPTALPTEYTFVTRNNLQAFCLDRQVKPRAEAGNNFAI